MDMNANPRLSLSLSLLKSETLDKLIRPPIEFGMLNRLYTNARNYIVLNSGLTNNSQGSYHTPQWMLYKWVLLLFILCMRLILKYLLIGGMGTYEVGPSHFQHKQWCIVLKSFYTILLD